MSKIVKICQLDEITRRPRYGTIFRVCPQRLLPSKGNTGDSMPRQAKELKMKLNRALHLSVAVAALSASAAMAIEVRAQASEFHDINPGVPV